MKLIIAFTAMLCLAAAEAQNAKSVEITGTYQVQITCHDTFHEETAMVLVPGADKFSGKAHALSIAPELKKKLRIGDPITVKGSHRPAKKVKMTKGQIRKAMVECIQQGKGIPLQAADMGGIIADIRMKAAQPAAHAHDHGKLELKAVADDHEVVEVYVVEHIEVTEININK